MPTLARPDVDVLDGLTTAIIVDQERMGANPRSTVGTATDANAMLRILFSRLGKPHIGSPRRSRSTSPRSAASGAITVERGGKTQDREARRFNRTGGMCPRCEGRGSVTDFDLTAALRRHQVAQRGRDHDPRLQHGGLVRPHLPRLRLLRPGQADPEVHQEGARTTCSTRSRPRSRSTGINLTYAGLIPQIQKSFLSKDVDAMQPHIRAFVERAVTFTTCPECDGTRLSEAARSSKINGDQHRRRLRDADQRPGRVGPRPRRAVGRAAARRRCGTRSTRSSRSGSATSASTGRRARSRAARRSAPR